MNDKVITKATLPVGNLIRYWEGVLREYQYVMAREVQIYVKDTIAYLKTITVKEVMNDSTVCSKDRGDAWG